jgi:uncharacterized protein YndB with AHSA1/START domain
MTTTQRLIRPAPVRKSIEVAVGRERAFEVFTARMGRWWPSKKSIGTSPQRDVVLEPRVGGRWFERGEDGAETPWGEVLAYERPARLLLAWRINAQWAYDPNFETEVEVLFREIGPGRTRVELEHRKLEAFGDKAEAMRTLFDGADAWVGVLGAYAQEVEAEA